LLIHFHFLAHNHQCKSAIIYIYGLHHCTRDMIFGECIGKSAGMQVEFEYFKIQCGKGFEFNIRIN
jgi:hypothetical protein